MIENLEDMEPMRTAAVVASESEFSRQHRARLVKTPEFRAALRFARLHGLTGLDEVKKVWIKEMQKAEADEF
jgi:hypothetical protein